MAGLAREHQNTPATASTVLGKLPFLTVVDSGNHGITASNDSFMLYALPYLPTFYAGRVNAEKGYFDPTTQSVEPRALLFDSPSWDGIFRK